MFGLMTSFLNQMLMKIFLIAFCGLFAACVERHVNESGYLSTGGRMSLEGEMKSAGLTIVQGGMEIDLAYAKDDPTGQLNFLKKNVYGTMRQCFLQPEVAAKLNSAQILLKKRLGHQATLVLFDCARPRSVQRAMWAILPDSRYVANPETGSRHNFGASVDLTFRDAGGSIADMGVPFDHFGPESAFDYEGVSDSAKKNRLILRQVMQDAGFIPYDAEWWHFDGVANPRERFKILDF